MSRLQDCAPAFAADEAAMLRHGTRDYLEKIGWNKQPPAPELPDDIVKATSAKYVEALRVLTGRDLT